MNKKKLKAKLKQLYDLRKEIKETERKIRRANKTDSLTDVVESSARLFPFNKTHVKILGQNPKTVLILETYNEILENRLLNLLELQAEVELFISKLPTSRLRRIFEMKYIECFSWQKIALKIGNNATSESIRKEHDRYLKEI